MSPNPGTDSGIIAGKLSYPSEFMPALTVYAVSVDGQRFYVLETVVTQVRYRMLGVHAGSYYVYAAVSPASLGGLAVQPPQRFGAGYTKAVPCGLDVKCTDHSMLIVHVNATATADNVDPTDWYAGSDAFPVIPRPLPAALSLGAPASSYGNALDAAVYYEQASTGGTILARPGPCPVNAACVRLGPEQRGTDASYFVATAQSNDLVVSCGVYLFNDGGWHRMYGFCRQAGDPFPAIGSTGVIALGMGETGCVNAHTDPALQARVLICLQGGTQVTIDSGPVFVSPPAGTDPAAYDTYYWWHVTGKGWVVHRYLANG